MLPEKSLKINPLKKVEAGPETWDRSKLLRFMDKYRLQNLEVAKGIGITKQYFCALKKGRLSFEPYYTSLTAYKNAIQKSKVAQVKAFAKEMIKHYNSFE